MAELEDIYRERFGEDVKFRKKMYEVLCRNFFQKYISKGDTVLDVAAGYCEFINNINAKNKIALDLNSDVKKYADKNVKTVISPSTNMAKIKSSSVDVVFVSNFFEHITKEDIVKTLREINRVLRPGGKLLVMQPNIRYCYKDYWMFFDHITPIDDRSLAEALTLENFEILENRPRFLPYTTKSRLPKSILLLRIYLKVPLLHRLFGGQAFIVARRKTK